MARTVSVAAPAKVNLFLRVLGKRPDGYHDIHTLFAAISLADRVSIRRGGEGIVLTVVGADLGAVSDNLVYRAADAFRRQAGFTDGVEIQLEKRVPVGGGLGGGSSDAAATLRGLGRLFGDPLDAPRLREIARGLGADVAFFLGGSTLALGTGRGDELTPLPPLGERPVVVVAPETAVGTAWAYARLAAGREGASRGQGPSSTGLPGPDELASWEGVIAAATNDFEAPVHAELPELRRAKKAVMATDPLLGLMSGSGSSTFGVYEDIAAALGARASLEAALPGARIFVTTTLSSFPEVEEGDPDPP